MWSRRDPSSGPHPHHTPVRSNGVQLLQDYFCTSYALSACPTIFDNNYKSDAFVMNVCGVRPRDCFVLLVTESTANCFFVFSSYKNACNSEIKLQKCFYSHLKKRYIYHLLFFWFFWSAFAVLLAVFSWIYVKENPSVMCWSQSCHKGCFLLCFHRKHCTIAQWSLPLTAPIQYHPFLTKRWWSSKRGGALHYAANRMVLRGRRTVRGLLIWLKETSGSILIFLCLYSFRPPRQDNEHHQHHAERLEDRLPRNGEQPQPAFTLLVGWTAVTSPGLLRFFQRPYPVL